MEILQAAGVIAGAIRDPKDKVEDDPQLKTSGFLLEADHPEVGRNRFEAIPMSLFSSPWELRRALPTLGEHCDYVYREILGVTDAEMEDLVAEGVI